jgi:hypothetical protein
MNVEYKDEKVKPKASGKFAGVEDIFDLYDHEAEHHFEHVKKENEIYYNEVKDTKHGVEINDV